jgi:hypothetical protein
MVSSELKFVPYRHARHQVRDSDLLLFRRRGLISIAGRGDHSHAAKAAWWDQDLFFVEGFNHAMLGKNDPIWAVAVPVTVRYEGDAQAGVAVRGHVFVAGDPATAAAGLANEGPLAENPDSPPLGLSAESSQQAHAQGFSQSPQRSR